MVVDIKKCSDTELWELLGDLSTILNTYKAPDNTSVIYMTWVKMFSIVRKEIDKRMSLDYEHAQN